ncbi:carboxypeptidase regulatory-like domain-containing protein [Noviherbaspirillum cavernae]|uniref:Carboxypeptidase regulatory-like domain-containing protein n=1 Tax=Noviherbaspirillum cavernae TaxID=2320862 RepID=A0A418X5G5_9BURK|nr:carboxypeptidase-like regulatory domain-containing protein [Noviherbaspirillum cavernae]RJG07712.1 carboxypeptidase regulatory-like domain-containing protein [Noviherbaspirillum cavernae]
MQQQKQHLVRHALIVAAITALTACGGGGGSADSGTPATKAPVVTLVRGTAASGAPFAGATVTLTDVNGTQKTTTAGADGGYSIDVKGMTAPFVVTATGTTGGITATYVAVLADTVSDGETKTVNVTPLTTAIAALLSDANNPLDMTDLAKLKAKATPAEVKKVVDALKSVLANVVTASGADAATFDPVKSAFKADRTGLDAVLDTIKVAITSDGVVLVNAFAPIAENQADPTAAPAPSVVLTRGNVATPPGALVAPTIAPSTVVINRLQEQLNACFALAADNRVTKTGPIVTDLKGACEVVDGFDRALYKYNGYTLFQWYGGLLSDPAMDGAIFGAPEILTLVKTAAGAEQAIIRLPYKRADGSTGHVMDMAQKISPATATDSGWRIIGNQLDYDVAVEARFSRGNNPANNGKIAYQSGLRLQFNAIGLAFDVHQVKVTGPGLPAAGVVLARSSSCGTANYFAVANKTGDLSVTATSNVSTSFALSGAFADGSSYTWSSSSPNFASAPVTDFSAFKPFGRYKFEVYRSASDKKAEFYTRSIAAPIAASYGPSLHGRSWVTAPRHILILPMQRLRYWCRPPSTGAVAHWHRMWTMC